MMKRSGLYAGLFLSLASASPAAAAAGAPEEVTLVLWGDSRENAGNATVRILEVLRRDIKDWDFMVHTGDFTSNGSRKSWERSLGYAGMREVFVKGKFFMCTSNHDRDQRNYDHFTKGVLPVNGIDGTTHFYHHQRGNVDLFFCDAHFTKPAVITAWLEGELKKVPRDHWIIGIWHEPCYSDLTYKSGSLKACRAWLDMLSKYGGDLVFHGHAHSYARTYPLAPDGHKDLRRGMVHIVNGTGGASFKDPLKRGAKTAFTPRTKSFPTIVRLRFRGSALELKAIDARPGRKLAVIDRWRWKKLSRGRRNRGR